MQNNNRKYTWCCLNLHNKAERRNPACLLSEGKVTAPGSDCTKKQDVLSTLQAVAGGVSSSTLMWEIKRSRSLREGRRWQMSFSTSFLTPSPTNMYLMWYLRVEVKVINNVKHQALISNTFCQCYAYAAVIIFKYMPLHRNKKKSRANTKGRHIKKFLNSFAYYKPKWKIT